MSGSPAHLSRALGGDRRPGNAGISGLVGFGKRHRLPASFFAAELHIPIALDALIELLCERSPGVDEGLWKMGSPFFLCPMTMQFPNAVCGTGLRTSDK